MPQNLRKTSWWFEARAVWATCSSNERINSLEERSSAYKASKDDEPDKDVFDVPRAAISVDTRVYVNVSHRNRDWVSLPDSDSLS